MVRRKSWFAFSESLWALGKNSNLKVTQVKKGAKFWALTVN